MSEFFEGSVYFGVLITFATYGVGMLLRKRVRLGLFHPLVTAVVLIIAFLKGMRMDYAVYEEGARYISYLLTPATICFAVPLYEQFSLLKKNYKAVLAGICAGVVTSLCSVLALAVIFRLDYASYVTFLPKSITTAIGMVVSKELGGHAAITVAAIVVTGVLGNIFAEGICRWFRIEESIAKGVALGTASHAMGTAKAMEMGEAEGAMSSLSVVVAGILTVVGAGIFADFL